MGIERVETATHALVERTQERERSRLGGVEPGMRSAERLCAQKRSRSGDGEMQRCLAWT
jgi:hypothetical protein